MAKKGDVELVIRAKNEATKAVESVAAALKELVSEQTKTGASAQKTDSLLGKLGAAFVSLNNEVQGLTALGKIARNLDQATTAVERLEKGVQQAGVEHRKLAGDLDAASAAVTRLTGQVAASVDALARQKAAVTAARAEQQSAVASYAAADRALTALANQVDRLKVPNAQLVVSYRQQRELLGQLRGTVSDTNTAYVRAKTVLDATTASHKENQTALRVATLNQRQVQVSADAASLSLQRQQEGLVRSQASLDEISRAAKTASTVLGGVAVNQDAVAAASRRAALDIQRVGEALAGQKGGVPAAGVTAAPAAQATAAYRAQIQAVRDAQGAWKAAQTQANTLGREIANTAQPTVALSTAFTLSQNASRAARQEYLAQGTALNHLRGTTTGTFAAFSQMADTVRRSSAVGGVAAGAQNNAAAASRNWLAELLRIPTAADRANAGIAGLNDTGRQSQSVFQRLRSEVLGLAASYIGLHAAVTAIGGLVKTLRDVEGAQSRLGIVFGQNLTKINVEMAWLRENAVRLGIPFSTLATEYTRFAVTARESNFTLEGTRKIFLSVAESARVNKLSVDETGRVFLALTQMIQKGTVQSEELRKQLGNALPGAFAIFSASIGVSTQKLGEMLERGDVLANEENLLKFAAELSKRFGPQLAASLQMVTAQLDIFRTKIELAKIDVLNGGFAGALGKAMLELNKMLDTDKSRAFFESIGNVLGKLVSIVPVVVQNFEWLTTALQLFVSIKIAFAIIAMIQGFGGLTTVMAQGTLVMTGMRTVATSLFATFSTGLVALINFRATLTAAAVAMGQFSIAAAAGRVSAMALSATLVGLRSIMVGMAGVASLMWAAIGGVPGIIITALTFIATGLLGDWISGVDDATEALKEHEKIITAVRKGYEAANGKIDEWASKIKSVTQFEVTAQLAKSVAESKVALDALQGPRRSVFSNMLSDAPVIDATLADKIEAIIEAFKRGVISAEDFRQQISAIGLASSSVLSKDFITNLIEGSRKLEEIDKRTTSYAAVLRVIRGTATAADREILGLGKAVGDLNDKFNTQALDRYNTALEKMRKLVPDLKKELARNQELETAKTQFEEATKSAATPEQAAEAKRLYEEVVNKITARIARDAAASFPVKNDDIVKRIIFVEGGQSPLARQPTTSNARGIGQFIEKTWLDLFNQVFPLLTELNDTQKLALRFNEEAATKMLHELTRQNQGQLIGKGIAPNAANTYLAHFLGASGAIKMILANPEELAKDIAGAAATNANQSVLGGGKTVQQVRDWAAQKMGGLSPITSSGATEAEKFDETAKERSKGIREETEALKALRDIAGLSLDDKFKANRAAEISKAIHKEEVEGLKASVAVSAERRAEIAKEVGALYDLKHAQELYNAKLAEENKIKADKQAFITNVVGLAQQRTTLLTTINQARNDGDTAGVEELKKQFKDLTDQITSAIPQARAFAEALGDQKAIAALDKVELSLKRIKLDIFTAKQINDMIVTGATDAFTKAGTEIGKAIDGTNSWADAIANVGDAFLQFAADFLLNIAKMILQQVILNALQSAGIGDGKGSIGGAIASGLNMLVGMFEKGGVVGSGVPSRPASANWFRNAQRYEGGGIAGLKANEVPAILHRNEEVLTRNDPRHVFNGGGQAAKGPDIKIVNAIDSGDFVSKGMSTNVGQRAILNFIRENKGAVKAAMG